MTIKKTLSAAKQTLVVFGLRESIHKTFGKYLASSVLSFHLTKTETRFHYLIPPMLCQPYPATLVQSSRGGNSTYSTTNEIATTTTASEPSAFPTNYLTTSACLAILDDLSSFACMAGDLTHRTGVSLSLSADLIQPSRMTALSEIDVLCKIDKIGRYVGFLTVEFVDRKDGRVVARGTHNKFLPTGFLWELLLSKQFFPLGLWLFQKYAGPHKYSTPIDFLFPERQTSSSAAKELLLSTSRPESLTRPLGSIWDLFPMKPVNTTPNNSTKDQIAKPDKKVYSYETEVTKETKNYVGLMHGGAVGSVIERACLLTRQRQQQEQQNAAPAPMIIDSMEVRYLSANKKALLVEVWDDTEAALLKTVADETGKTNTSTTTLSSRSVGVIRDAKTGQVNVQFICHWRVL